MKFYIYIAVFVGGLALLGGTFTYGYFKGSAAEILKIAEKTAETQQKLFDLADNVRKQTEKLRIAQQEKEALINELEQEAIQAPGSSSPGVAATGGLQRLERRWSTSPRSTD